MITLEEFAAYLLIFWGVTGALGSGLWFCAERLYPGRSLLHAVSYSPLWQQVLYPILLGPFGLVMGWAVFESYKLYAERQREYEDFEEE